MAASNESTVRPVLKIEWGGGTGDIYYSDADDTVGGETLLGRALRWGNAVARLQRGPNASAGTFTITLAKLGDDGAGHNVLSAIQAEGAGGHRATLFHAYDNDVEGSWVTLWKGVTMPDTTADEIRDDVVIRMQDIGADSKHPVGAVINRVLFPNTAEEDEGKVVPVVWGKVNKVPCPFVKGGGPKSESTIELEWDGARFFVDDATDFSSGSIDVWVGQERMTGSFSGNEFTISVRPVVVQGSLTAKFNDTSNPYQIRLDSFTGNAEDFVGLALKMRVKDVQGGLFGPPQYRKIVQWETDGSDTILWVINPFSTHTDPDFIIAHVLPGERTFWGYQLYHPGDTTTTFDAEIVTLKQPHWRGEIVQEASPNDEYVFIATKSGATQVKRVYIGLDNGEFWLAPRSLYTVDTNDNQFVSEIGGNATTITFKRPPGLLSNIVGDQTSRIFADVWGPGAGGAPYENPATVIDELAQAEGISAGDIDAGAISAAESARSRWKVSLAITRARPLADVLSDIAHQTFMAIDWSQGLRLVTLDNSFTVATAVSNTFDDSNTLDSHRLVRKTDTRKITTEVVANYVPQVRNPEDREERVHRQRDAAAGDPLARYGLKQKRIDAWALAHVNPVRTLAYETLFRERFAREILEVDAWLDMEDVLVGELVGIGVIGTGLAARGWVSQISHQPGSDNVRFEIEVPPAEWYLTHNPPDPHYQTKKAPDSPEYTQYNAHLYWLPTPFATEPSETGGGAGTGNMFPVRLTSESSGEFDWVEAELSGGSLQDKVGGRSGSSKVMEEFGIASIFDTVNTTYLLAIDFGDDGVLLTAGLGIWES